MGDPLRQFARAPTSLLGFLTNGAAMDGGVVRRWSMPSKKGCGLPPPNAAADVSRYAVTEIDVYECRIASVEMLSDVAERTIKDCIVVGVLDPWS